MVQQRNAEQISRLAQPFGQGAVFEARRDVIGGVIVGTNPGAGIHQDQGLEDLARMDDGQIERAGGDDIDPDQTMFRIETTDEELFPVPVSYTHLRAHETVLDLVCRLLLEKKKSK